MYRVCVNSDYRWAMATVGGRHFTKHAAVEIQESDMTEEIRQSPILDVVEIVLESDPEPEQKAEPKPRSRRKEDR